MKPKKIVKSKEQLLQDLKQRAEVRRMRLIVRNDIYPFLLKNSANIEDAKMMCGVLTQGWRQAFQARMLEVTVAELDLVKKMDTKNSDYKKFSALNDMLKDEKLVVALNMLEGMPQAIDVYLRKENQTRTLKSLKDLSKDFDV